MSARRVQPRKTPAKSSDARRLLIVEPDDLISWSLRAYLRQWFAVRALTTARQAQRSLRQRPVHALVISDHVSADDTEQLIQAARRRNPEVRVVVVGQAGDSELQTNEVFRIGKPFELPELAHTLGLEPQDSRDGDPHPPTA